MKHDRVRNNLRSSTRLSTCSNDGKNAIRILARNTVMLPALIALFSIIYYILGPSRGFFHSDCTDTIYWADAAVESGRLLNPDFGYAALLPFGANLWLIPLIRLFGLNYGTHVAGMLIFALIYSAATLYLATQLRIGSHWRVILVTVMLLLLSGSNKLREIMWGHIIYYSLGILFLMVGLGLIAQFDSGRRVRSTLLMLGLLTAGVATNGIQSIALFLLPLAGAVVLERFFAVDASWRDGQTSDAIRLVTLMSGMTLFGLLLLIFLTRQGDITAGYANAYSTFSQADNWCANAAKIVPNLLSLYGIAAPEGATLASFDAFVVLMRLAGLAIIFITPVVMLANYRHLKHKMLKIVLWTHHLTAAIILFLVTLGSLGNANWRLTPVLGTAVLTTVIGLAWILGDGGRSEHVADAQALKALSPKSLIPSETNRMCNLFVTPRKRLAAVCLVILLLNASITAGQICILPVDYGRDNTVHQLSEYLLAHELEYGYAMFWQSQAITLLSGQKVNVRNVTVDQNGISPRLYQSNKNWYHDQPDTDEYFLLLDPTELDLLLRSPDWPKLEQLVRETLSAPAGYTVVILSQNPWVLLENDKDQ